MNAHHQVKSTPPAGPSSREGGHNLPAWLTPEVREWLEQADAREEACTDCEGCADCDPAISEREDLGEDLAQLQAGWDREDAAFHAELVALLDGAA